MAFVHDQLFDGRPFRVLTVVDQFSRQNRPGADAGNTGLNPRVAALPLGERIHGAEDKG